VNKLPNILECAYCIRNSQHGGECHGKPVNHEKGCLGFERDNRGCIRSGDFLLSVPILYDFPLLNVWNQEWQIHGYDTEMRVKKIYGIRWDKGNGELLVSCNCEYFIDEFAENHQGEKPEPKAVLKVIK